MAGIDWTQFSPSSGGGGIQWHKVGTAPAVKAPKSSSSSSGWLDSITNPIGHYLGGSGPLGGVESVIGNAAGQGMDIIHGIPGLYHVPQMAWHDITRPHVSLIDLIGNHSKGLRGLGQELHDPKGLIGPTYMPIETDVSKARHGDWHYFQQHPLNPILDVATVASLGGAGALKLATAGKLGERLGTLAKSERVLTATGEHEFPVRLREAKTLQGRIRQQWFDRYSMANPDKRIVGVDARVSRILNTRAAVSMLRARVPVRQFQRLTQQLTPSEKFAFHVAAEDVPLDDRILFYKAQVAVKPTKVLRGYLKQLESPGVRDALTNPRPEFTAALWKGHGLEAAAGQRLMESGLVSPESRTERAALPREMMLGTWKPGREIPSSAYEAPSQEELLHQLQTQLMSMQSRLDSGSLRVQPKIAAIEAEIEAVRNGTSGLLESRPAMREPDVKVPGEAPGVVNSLHPDFPPAFRFWHTGGSGKTLEGSIMAPGTERMLGKQTLDQTKRSLGVRLQRAAFQTDPERVLSTDYLSTMRHELILGMQKEALLPISEALSADHTDTGFKKPDEWYFRPSFDRKATAPVGRVTKEAEKLTQDRQALDVELQQSELKGASEGVVSKKLSDLGVDKADLENLDKLNALGIRRIPNAYGKDFLREFHGTAAFVRNFIDRPLDVWRAITLNFRPAWAANNLTGNAIMGLLSHPDSALAYLRVLRTEGGLNPIRHLWNWTRGKPSLRRKYAAIFDEVAPELHSAGLFGTQTKVTAKGIHEGTFRANPAVRALGFVPKKVGRGIMAVGRGITKAEVLLAEDTGREAVFISAAGGDLAKIRASAKAMGEGNISLAEALRRMDKESVERAVTAVNDALGNFNDLNHTERAYLRRAIPFFSWYKVVTKVSAKYAARYPARLKLLQNIEQAQNKDGEPALPSWLVGSILLGKPKNGTQSLLSTTGINPYETIPQTAEGGPVGLLNPLIGAGVIGAAGRNAAFGNLQDYYGPGATSRGGWPGFAERFVGSTVGSLAPVRLLLGETTPYQGKLYDPTTYRRNLLLQYLGLPLRDVKVQEAKRERGL